MPTVTAKDLILKYDIDYIFNGVGVGFLTPGAMAALIVALAERLGLPTSDLDAMARKLQNIVATRLRDDQMIGACCYPVEPTGDGAYVTSVDAGRHTTDEAQQAELVRIRASLPPGWVASWTGRASGDQLCVSI